MIFDQILTKSDQILIMYVKNHQIHVKQIQECHFAPQKKSNVKNQTGFGWGGLGYIWGGIGGKTNNNELIHWSPFEITTLNKVLNRLYNTFNDHKIYGKSKVFTKQM